MINENRVRETSSPKLTKPIALILNQPGRFASGLAVGAAFTGASFSLLDSISEANRAAKTGYHLPLKRISNILAISSVQKKTPRRNNFPGRLRSPGRVSYGDTRQVNIQN
jgi:hypothetical protein